MNDRVTHSTRTPHHSMPAELHEIQQAIDERAARASSSGGGSGIAGGPQGSGSAPPRIIVGGTGLLHPPDLCHQLFAEL